MAKKIESKKVDKSKKPTAAKSARPAKPVKAAKVATKPAVKAHAAGKKPTGVKASAGKAAAIKPGAIKPAAKKAVAKPVAKKLSVKKKSAPLKAAPPISAKPAAKVDAKIAVKKATPVAPVPKGLKKVEKPSEKLKVKVAEKGSAKVSAAPALKTPVPEKVAKKSIVKNKIEAPEPEEPLEAEVEEESEIEAEAEADESDEVVLTDAEGRRYCRVKDCDQISTVDGYCRYHYLLFWKKIQVRKKILTEGKLERYIEELTARYPDKFLEMLRKDLRSDKEFLAAIAELEIDESATESEFEDEAQNYIDEVRGMGEPTTRDDEGDF